MEGAEVELSRACPVRKKSHMHLHVLQISFWKLSLRNKQLWHDLITSVSKLTADYSLFHGSVQRFSLKKRKNVHQISHDLGNSEGFHRFQPAGLKVLLLYFCEQDSNENRQPKYGQVVYQKYSISQLIAPAPAEPVGGQLTVNTRNYLIVWTFTSSFLILRSANS